jgi:hypothetical protein
MTKEGRLQRGKENFERGRFLDNPETLEYLESLPKKKAEVKKDGE